MLMLRSRYVNARHLGRWFAGCIVLLLAGSFIPLAWKVEWGLHGAHHFRVHVAAFAVIGTLAFLSASSFDMRFARLVALSVMAVGIEFFQTVFFGNTFEWSDLKADGCGMLVAFFLTELLRQCVVRTTHDKKQ